MAKIFVGDAVEALDEERIALRVKVAMLKERGNDEGALQQASERLNELNGQLRAIVSARLCKVGGHEVARHKTRKPAG